MHPLCLFVPWHQDIISHDGHCSSSLYVDLMFACLKCSFLCGQFNHLRSMFVFRYLCMLCTHFVSILESNILNGTLRLTTLTTALWWHTTCMSLGETTPPAASVFPSTVWVFHMAVCGAKGTSIKSLTQWYVSCSTMQSHLTRWYPCTFSLVFSQSEHLSLRWCYCGEQWVPGTKGRNNLATYLFGTDKVGFIHSHVGNSTVCFISRSGHCYNCALLNISSCSTIHVCWHHLVTDSCR